MGRPPRPIKRVTVSVRFEPDEIAAIDAARGDATRQEWLHEAGVCKPHGFAPPGDPRRMVPGGLKKRVRPEPKLEPKFGPVRAKPGARLK